MCKAGEFNLSYASLTSLEARRVLCELPESDPDFWAELTQPRTRLSAPALTTEEALEEDADAMDLDNPGDDSVVPLEVVAELMAGDADISDEFVPGDEWGLVSTADAEETLREVIEGVEIDTTQATKNGEGRGQRKKMKNRLYPDDLWVNALGSEEEA
jgi:hypothetical protein